MSLRVGILQCDEVHEDLRGEFGDYPEMFISELGRLRPDWSFPVFRLFEGVFPKRSSCDGYITTGSSFGVNDAKGWIRQLEEFVRKLSEGAVPYVGICFGHQLLARALGGRVAPAEVGWGVGIHSCSHAPASIPGLPAESKLLVSHQDQVTELGEGTSVIGGSEFCPHGWIRFGDHMLGIQGHPEFSKPYAKALMDLRRELIGEEAYQNGTESLGRDTDSGQVFELIVRFIEETNCSQP
ncbi:MAG: GMP synthase [Verrucomicrobiales bacterium]|nr:GMP synthase [Verrucomicrobiales bacterium]|tara:strand:- start:1329 stop:2045 length:717 start_codon:yes stop_codon:yes gene_type:complete